MNADRGGVFRQVLSFLGLWLGLVSMAHASFGDCHDPAYLSRFDERLSSGAFDCVERVRIPVPSASGEKQVRIIHHLFADWLAQEAELRRFEQGMRDAAAAIGVLGGADFRDTTVLLLDSSYRGPDAVSDAGEVAALAVGASPDECRVVVYLMSPAIDPVVSAHVVAHELFHCVQIANLSREQMASGSMGTGGGGDWWLEGSAEWFAQFAVRLPDSSALADRVAHFDADSLTRPLHDMDYGSVVFFLWLAQQANGEREILPFLRRMASSRAAQAQRQAMQTALSADQWLAFAQAYMDGGIRDAQGRALPSSPVEGAQLNWSDTRTHSLRVQAFQIVRARLAFTCGRWRLSASPDSAHGYRDATGAGWFTLPAQLDTQEDETLLRYVGIISGTAARYELQLQGRRESACGVCAEIRALDSCIVGTWSLLRTELPGRLSSKVAQLGQFSANMTSIIHFGADGHYALSPVDIKGSFRGHRGQQGQGLLQGSASGRWSAAEGQLNFCHDDNTLAGHATVQTRGGGRVTIPIPPSPPSVQKFRYQCSETELLSEMHIPGLGPVKTTYGRSGR